MDDPFEDDVVVGKGVVRLSDVESKVKPVELTDSEIEVEEPIEQAMIPSGQHIVAGLGTLGTMSEEEFRAKAAEMRRGIDRIRSLQETLLDAGTDYGVVKGIPRPFLQKPGAEKLALFGGYAVSFRIQRDVAPEGRRDVPQLSYVTYCQVHLGNTAGPVVAEGVGEANSYEERYRYRWQNPICSRCSKDNTIIHGKQGGKLAGKWWCAGFKGGCGAIYAPDEIEPAKRVENDDPWDLANTLVKMSKKRSMVDGILTATGTSGLFSQDLDSPSVQRQAAEAGDDAPEPEMKVEAPTTEATVAAGGVVERITQVQLRTISSLSVGKSLGPEGMAALMNRVLGTTVRADAVKTVVRTLSGKQAGQLIHALETGEIETVKENE